LVTIILMYLDVPDVGSTISSALSSQASSSDAGGQALNVKVKLGGFIIRLNQEIKQEVWSLVNHSVVIASI